MLRAGSLALWMVMLPVVAQAADPGPPPPMPPPAAPSADLPPPPPPPPPRECYPGCGAGSVCNDGVCSSASPQSDAPRAQPGVVVGEDGERAPPGFHFETQRRRGMLITGPILLGVGYVVAASVGFLSSISYTYGNNNSSYLLNFIPLAGPVLARLAYGTQFASFGDWLYTVGVTAVQGTGLALLLIGLTHHQVLVENEYDGPQDRERQRDSTLPPIQWSLAPFAPGAPLGFTLTVLN